MDTLRRGARRAMLARTRCVVLALTIAVAGGMLGCNRNNPVGPSSACSITLFPSTLRLSNAGGKGVVVVSTPSPQCSWTATAIASWITVDTGPSIGPGPLRYTVAPNPTWETRTGTLTVGTEVHRVVQACAYDVSPASTAVYGDTGGQGSIAVSTTAGCPWAATTSESWLTVVLATSSQGTGAVTYRVARHTGSSIRTGVLHVAGTDVTITQGPAWPAGCTITGGVPPSIGPFDANGGRFSFFPRAPAGCLWNATTSDPWLTIVSDAVGQSSGAIVTVDVASFIGTGQRSAVVHVGDWHLPIVQFGN
jgi:all-beta uncharacterized protein/BACON domain-containing protein